MTTKKLPNYSRAKIYKIISNQTDDIYIGSTTKEYLSQRMTAHKYDYKQYLGGKGHYIASFDLLKYDDVKIVLLEAYPECKTRDELYKYEQEWLDKLECVNRHRSNRTEEYKKEYNREWHKKYYHDNKDIISGKVKQKRLDNLDEFREADKIRGAKWRANNREFRNSKIECDVCSKKISRCNMSRHKKIHKL
jgi:hypothetical protein